MSSQRQKYLCMRILCICVSLSFISQTKTWKQKRNVHTLCVMLCYSSLYGAECMLYLLCVAHSVWLCELFTLSCLLSLSLSLWDAFFPSLVFWQEAPPIASCPLLLSVPQGDKLFINHFLFLYRYAFKKLFLIRLLSCISCICDLAAAEAPSCPPGYILQ